MSQCLVIICAYAIIIIVHSDCSNGGVHIPHEVYDLYAHFSGEGYVSILSFTVQLPSLMGAKRQRSSE
jgi:hypothetical protein